MKPWIAAVFGSFASVVIAAFTLTTRGNAGGRELLFLVGSAGAGSLVGYLAFRRSDWIQRGAAWQLLWAGAVGAATGFLLSIVSAVFLFATAAQVANSMVIWSLGGGIAAMLLVLGVWFQIGEVPFQHK